jgi:hypothetical protein
MEESILPKILLNRKQVGCGGTGRQKTKRRKLVQLKTQEGIGSNP